MPYKLIPLVLTLAISAPAIAQTDLHCQFPIAGKAHELGDIVRPRTTEETKRMRQAPHGAKRPSRRKLQINWAHGFQVFEEKAPYDEGLDGVWYAYCGYSPDLGLHLMMKQDGDLFTGVMMEESTGKLLPGGENVLFSPDRKHYIALEQQNGRDGNTVKLYDSRGILLWNNGDHLDDISSLRLADDPDIRWDKKNRILAEAVTQNGKAFTVQLFTTADRQRKWVPLPTN